MLPELYAAQCRDAPSALDAAPTVAAMPATSKSRVQFMWRGHVKATTLSPPQADPLCLYHPRDCTRSSKFVVMRRLRRNRRIFGTSQCEVLGLVLSPTSASSRFTECLDASHHKLVRVPMHAMVHRHKATQPSRPARYLRLANRGSISHNPSDRWSLLHNACPCSFASTK